MVSLTALMMMSMMMMMMAMMMIVVMMVVCHKHGDAYVDNNALKIFYLLVSKYFITLTLPPQLKFLSRIRGRRQVRCVSD